MKRPLPSITSADGKLGGSSKSLRAKALFAQVETVRPHKDKRGRPWVKDPRQFAATRQVRVQDRKVDDDDDLDDDADISSSSDDDDSDGELELGGDVLEDINEVAEWNNAAAAAPPSLETPPVNSTRRLALLNFDWDQVKVDDLFVLMQSFLPGQGHVEKVTIYPSTYGLQRLEYEAKHGPPELAAPNPSDTNVEEEVSHPPSLTSSKQQEWNQSSLETRRAIRRYQLNRLRYYYAIVEFDSPQTADLVHSQCNDQEFEESGLRLDLRFVADDETFDIAPEHAHLVSHCSEVATANYVPRKFDTPALHSTRVELTWDRTPDERLAWLRDQFKAELDPRQAIDGNRRDELSRFMTLSSSGTSTAANSDVDEPDPAPTVPHIHRHRPRKMNPSDVRQALLGLEAVDDDVEENQADSEQEEEVLDLGASATPGEEEEGYDLGLPLKFASKQKAVSSSVNDNKDCKRRRVSKIKARSDNLGGSSDGDSSEDDDASSLVTNQHVDGDDCGGKRKKHRLVQREKIRVQKAKARQRSEDLNKLWLGRPLSLTAPSSTTDVDDTEDNQLVEEDDDRFDLFLTDPAFTISQTHRDYPEAVSFLAYMRRRRQRSGVTNSAT